LDKLVLATQRIGENMQYKFIYEAIIEPDQCGYYASIPELEAAYTDGSTLEEVAYMVVEMLELVLTSYLDDGLEIPEPIFNHEHQEGDILMLVPIELDDKKMAAMKYISLEDAAEDLDVSKSRVCNLIKAGKLKTIGEGTSRRVSLESINAYEASKRKAGRPRKSDLPTVSESEKLIAV
jgi:excisionase family DNA binding protein